MLYLIGPDGLVNWGFINFLKMVWMITVHVLILRIKHQKSSEIIMVFRPLPVRGHVRALFLTELHFSDMKADPHPLPGNELRYIKTSENFRCLILNLGMHIILIHAAFEKFAYLRFTGYAH